MFLENPINGGNTYFYEEKGSFVSLPELTAPGGESVAFPQISYEDFEKLPKTVREDIIARNRIINSDAYNRVMDHLLSQRDVEGGTTTVATAEATYSLQLRRSHFSYLVACGLEDAIERLTYNPISKIEFEFAKDYMKAKGIPFFNEEMWRSVVEDHDGVLPIEIHGVKDGTLLAPGEPFFTVTGPSELVAHFEHHFHRVFYQSLVATKARALLEVISDPTRFIEVGLRGAIADQQHMQALHAAYVGGGFTLTSSDCGPAALPIKPSGTIGHRYVQSFADEESAFRFAIEHLDRVTLLVDLVESYQGIDLALRLKDEYRDTSKAIWVRIDSGDIKEQVRYYLQQTNKHGLTNQDRDKLVVEGVDSLDEIAEIEEMIINEFGESARARVMYGAGSLLISDGATRTDASSGFKLCQYTETDGTPTDTMKFSSSPGKGSYPGAVELSKVNGERLITQKGEMLVGNVEPLFELLYSHLKPVHERSSPEEARTRTESEFSKIREDIQSFSRAQRSAQTIKKMNSVRARYGLVDTHQV